VLLAGIASLPTPAGNIPLLPAGQQVRAIEGLARGPQLHAIDPLSNGNFISPAGRPDPSWSFGWDSGFAGLSETQGSDPATAALVNFTASAPNDQSGGGNENATGSASTETAGPLGQIQVVCERLVQQVQAGGKYWNAQAASGRPVRVEVDSSADPTQGPSGYPSNLSRQGSAGAWCRPTPVPFEDSSPLASRTFWTPILVVLCGIIVFWLSRGVKLPP
jgi:hypothetical protein